MIISTIITMRTPEFEKKEEIPAPMQVGSVKEYCETFYIYAVASGKSTEDIKEKFIRGLLPAYEAEVKRATSCDSGLPFDSLIDRLTIFEKNRVASPEQ